MEMFEKVARAIVSADGTDPDKIGEFTGEPYWMLYVDEARAAIAAYNPNERLSPANRDCLAKAKPGEPMFIILGRDPDGANIVRLWAQRRAAAGGDPDHTGPVFVIADAMDAWRAAGNLPESAPDAASYPPIGHERLREAAIHLRRSGDDAIVSVILADGCEVDLIRERADGNFSHIIEPIGIARAVEEAH